MGALTGVHLGDQRGRLRYGKPGGGDPDRLLLAGHLGVRRPQYVLQLSGEPRRRCVPGRPCGGVHGDAGPVAAGVRQ
ncbi:hypothetical protein CJD44_09715, partial [Streptomyces sp. alain-838]